MLGKYLLGVLLASAAPVLGDNLEGKVIRVIDGDTVVVRDSREKELTFHLLGVAAPEKGQKGYANACAALKAHADGKKVMVDWLRSQICASPGVGCLQLAQVFVSRNEDAGLRLIQKGLAWHDTRQLREQSTTDKTLYRDAELSARRHHLGIWSGKEPQPPWNYAAKHSNAKRKKLSKKKAAPADS